LQAWH